MSNDQTANEAVESNSGAVGESLWADAWKRLKRNRLAMFSLCIMIGFVAMAAYGSLVYWRYNIIDANPHRFFVPSQKILIKVLDAESFKGKEAPYDVVNLDKMYLKPCREHIMGTDGLGRDVFQRIIQGSRIAFQVGVITSIIAILIGVVLGCLAGYFGGWIDDLIVWFYSTFASMPDLLFILAIAMVVGKGLTGIYIGIGLTTWVGLCRLMRGEVMKHKERVYVNAARALGLGDMRILFGHILPNIMHLIVITFSMRFPAAVGTEVFMSFLGIGVQNEPSWGVMIGTARLRLWNGMWWEMTFTTLAILFVVLAFNLFGDALRDALDPRLRTRSEK